MLSKNSDIRKALFLAADLIEKIGWTQGNLTAHDSRGELCGVCAMGAINRATAGFEVDDSYQLRWDCLDAVQENLIGPGPYYPCKHPVAQWNDVEGRTAEEVTAKLREVARDLS